MRCFLRYSSVRNYHKGRYRNDPRATRGRTDERCLPGRDRHATSRMPSPRRSRASHVSDQGREQEHLSHAANSDAAVAMRNDFEKYIDSDVTRAARLFVKFGMNTIDEIIQAMRKRRGYGDLRRVGYTVGDLEHRVDLCDYSTLLADYAITVRRCRLWR